MRPCNPGALTCVTERRIQLHTLLRLTDEDGVLAEGLHFSEVSRYTDTADRALKAVQANVAGLVSQQHLLDLYQRLAPSTPEVREFTVELKPPRKLPLWNAPLALGFFAAVWQIPGEGWSAWLPDLRIEVFSEKAELLEARVRDEIEIALRRNRISESLWSLAAHQRTTGLTISSRTIRVDVPTPKELALRDAAEPKEASTLEQVAQDLTTIVQPEAYEYAELARQLADALSEPQAESVLIVGQSGVGKTAVFQELVRRRSDLSFGRTPFWATSGARLVAGMSGFGMWQERCDKLRREASRTRAILHLGNLVELMEVGKGAMIQQGIAGFLRPFIARGELLCVVECTPEQLPLIEREDPHLLGVFRRLEIPEPDAETATAILMSAAHEVSSRAGKELISLDTLETLDALHRRYATYSAYPGRPLRFLKTLLADRESAATQADVFDAFTRETGLPRLMLDTSMPLNLAQVKGFFNDRIIGQEQATDLVADLLATVKSGLSRPRRPLASFLFAGPTGVGKTETSKALAEFLFNDRGRITRFDMSEFGSPAAVQRLTGGVFGEEGLLTARVREQPFSVLLFDEFEKAHPLFFDLLLQVLGEARLTDAAGRLADFSNCVIIMTSNLGAEGYMQGGIGFASTAADAAGHFTKALQEFVRPELLNRIDRVVPFMPLERASVLRIVDRELELLLLRPGLRATGARLEVTPRARQWIADRAYQPALGARPLKREIEQRLLVPLAEALNTQPTVYALHAVADVRDTDLHVAVKPLTGDDARPQARTFSESWLANLSDDCVTLRRKLQTALRSEAVLRLRNEAYRLQRSIETAQRLRKKHPDRALPPRSAEAEHRLAEVRSTLRKFEAAHTETCDAEDRLSLALIGRSRLAEVAAREEVESCRRQWGAALRALMKSGGGAGRSDQALVYVYSHHNELMFDLALGYWKWSEHHARARRLIWVTRELEGDRLRDLQRRAEFDAECAAALRRAEAEQPEGAPRPALYLPADSEGFLLDAPEETGAVLIRMDGEDIGLKLQLESGTHRFKASSDADPVDVDVRVLGGELWTADVPVPRGMAGQLEWRRTYDLAQHQATDVLLAQVLAWTGNRLDGVLTRGVEAGFERYLERQVGL